jgi:dipeptidyl aminopeptidase/acylaminoacyl peptidase
MPLCFRALAALLLLPCNLPAREPEPAKPLLSIPDLYRLDSPATPALSPNGTRLAYARQWNDAKTRTSRSSLWLVEGSREKARALEPGEPDARVPLFSPDGKWIVFLSTRPRPEGWKQTPLAPPESDPATDLWLIPAAGGTAIPLAGPEKPYGRVFNDGFYGCVAFAPDGKRLIFVADDGKDPRTKEEIDNDVQVVRPDQGEGYTGYGPAQVWVAHLDESPGKYAAAKIERLTDDDVWYGDPQWSPDGGTIAVHANRTAERESARYSINHNFDIWAIDVATKKLKQLTKGEGPEVSPRFAPDGKRIVCLSVPRKGSHRDVFNLLLIDLTGSEPATKVLFNYHGADKLPHPSPFFPLPQGCWEDDAHLLFTSETGLGNALVRFDLAAVAGELLDPAAAKGDPAAAPKTLAAKQRRRQALTPPGNTFLKERSLGTSKTITWTNGGLELEGLLTLPPTATGAMAPHKLIVFPHGGPHSRTTRGFNFTAEILAANGYAVFQPNFRGSSGYGQRFIDADRLDLGGEDMRDILASVDKLIADGVADKDRLFVYGVSYGGFMTTWLVGHTDRFRAAVAQNAVTDLNMMWGLSDIPSWTEWEFNGKPWEVPGRMRDHSPLTYADRVKTPTLMLHSRDDRRCPLPMGRAFHAVLRDRGVPTGLVIYPNEGHGIRQPRHVEDVLTRLLAWFEKYGK